MSDFTDRLELVETAAEELSLKYSTLFTDDELDDVVVKIFDDGIRALETRIIALTNSTGIISQTVESLQSGT